MRKGNSGHSTKRVPTELKELRSTTRTDRDAIEPIKFEVLRDNPDPPEYFGEIATAEYHRILDQYKATKIFSQLDLPSIRIYCKAVETVDEIEIGLMTGKYQRFFITETGYQQIHPIISVLTKAKDDVKVFGERLGVTPVSRTKISGLLGKDKKKDEFGEMFDGKTG